MKHILAITSVALACTGSPSAVLDAGIERPRQDSTTAPGDVAVPLAVDFTVEGCPNFNGQAYTCTGKAPLAVRFVALATTSISGYVWAFGDASAFDSEIAPAHVYVNPGTYSVRLLATGTAGDSAAKVHTGFIVVTRNTIGEACDTTSQCDQGLFCLCGSGGGTCRHGPGHGICAANCYAGDCDETAVCAGLFTVAAPVGQSEAWQAPICLRTCTSDHDCSGGLRCRTLPPGPTTAAWVHGCFSAVPGDVGDSCLDENGRLRDDLCASGMCANFGAKGLCSADCSKTSCPPGADCAELGDGRKLCLRPCLVGLACAEDPLITCAVPAAGTYGYQVPASAKASSYCFPKPCASNEECPAIGTCPAGSGARYCIKRSD